VFFPGVRRRTTRIPHAFVTFALGITAVSLTVVAWALWAPSPAGNGSRFVLPAANVTEIRSVAYTIPGPEFDDVVVRPASGGGLPRVVATFPSSGLTNVHARGVASPHGEFIAIQWVPPFSTAANLSIVELRDSSPSAARVPDVVVDPFSIMAWASDGTRFAVTRTERTSEAERTLILEVNAQTLTAVPVAEYTGILDVAPVGYSFDGQRLFVVVVDQKGSNLHAVGAGKTDVIAELSPGRTQDWALSPDGSRLAFVDILGGGSRTYIGRTLLLATGQISTAPATRNQFGATWAPGSPSPGFGGPGGDWQLTDPVADGVVLVPNAWSPDGSYLVATLNSPVPGEGPPAPPVIELISRESATAPSARIRISEASGAAFLGWVSDLD